MTAASQQVSVRGDDPASDGPVAMELHTVEYRKQGRVATVRLNRPHVLNAMNLAMHAELSRVWDDIEADDDIWLVVLSGAGGRAFSVGQDLTELAERIENGSGRSSFGSAGKPGYPRITERFSFAKPIIAKVSGYALGGGFELALACDIVVATEEAQFGLPEATLGLIPGAGGVFRLPRQMPYRIAMGHLLTGRTMSAARACELGLINEVVAEADLDACVSHWATDILACAPLSVRAIKEAAAASLSRSLPEAFAAEYRWETVRAGSADAEEGPRAFAEKRTPNWTGH
ncbi:crotonobetainyl-CoA hydratase/dehydration protein DpgD [Nocardia tenerifensis]|uniref:Crotonobetainyl-CoA hydratase/dehydration protein DpgD n=1 Tax=Nocardia tenerifensis TaxID=228006 RepID=A0A318JV00_9NOCA|nr:enoyl-CoA-hydratase DpgD [Nocardia tenerifensis]PXX60924.1 crotonobetainyl-CoA hydratase/dehydration protein DpgD [Nocardia tenerifensis]